ncbi:xanthine dehydrogenase family protein molybdopterin-binding subunit [Plastoroseomonas hellenica]|uniref:Xanthine dehydrogenase family protein molybdopterin-binding subunit n=1 Tax=Plastoroseomonas hellenica TaxID=2687306 RepID=A0ABS5ETA1_9PROT|nr:molybdopterin cofactor-binding domain-containing protein [Plastoroseomonas hellenica]MBR0642574.1 xanthine dehydrogenase family protein molybdopterin-binding subunit [Plastoroseomonas hellenica]MBR0663527.1 xanthine dehydrogenase family protein molybdopterin-binding subunit [Plastoroseomonas hellenica]
MNAITNRRGFLQAGAALTVAFSVGLRPRAAAAWAEKPVAADEVGAFLSIDAQGAVTVYVGKVDLGTGVRTAFMQIAAEELDVPMARVTVVEGDTALTPDQGATYGSLSIQNGGVALRAAAATARREFLRLAGERLNTPPAELRVEDGAIIAGSRRVTYAELVGGRAINLKVDANAPIKPPEARRVVGRSAPRVDIPEKVFGRFHYVHDLKRPGMLHGRPVRPPAMGAIAEAVDEASLRDIPGVVRVVHQGGFVGVVAESEWSAIRAAQALRVRWSDWAGLPEQAKIWEHVRATPVAQVQVTSERGDARRAIEGAPKQLAATYDFAIHSHASMGPSCAVAEFQGDRLTVWSASQATHNLRKQLAMMLGVEAEKVRCVYMEGAGCYGRNGHEDAAADAALLAKAVGRPVRVQWMRADEHGWDPKGPPHLVDLRAGIDTQGNITGWLADAYIPKGAGGNVDLTAAELASLPREQILSPGNIVHNLAHGYAMPAVKTTCHRLETTPFRPSWIRTPGRMQNTFATEAFLDECAAEAGADPVEYRLRLLPAEETRGREALERVARLADWQTRASPQRDRAGAVLRGRGVTYVKYELVRTYVAAVAEVEVTRGTGAIRVTRFFCTHDCGQMINPDGVRAQVEGNIVHTLSRVLKEELTYDRRAVTSLDWASYPVITFPEVPPMTIELIDRPAERPWGAGEPAAAIVPSAVSNAIYDATGVRMRSVPFTPAKLLAALRGA